LLVAGVDLQHGHEELTAAEILGNDFVISLVGFLTSRGGSSPNDPFIEPAVFVHELGHMLGLHRMGDVGTPASALNYLSVMNYDDYGDGGLRAGPGNLVKNLRGRSGRDVCWG
jgi:hypothetical protein